MSLRFIDNRVLRRFHKISSYYLFKKKKYLKKYSKIVSFTFDDFPKTAVSNGARILEYYGKKGTFYMSFGLRGKTSPSGEIAGMYDLNYLKNREHEIACHTYSHIDCINSNLKNIKKDCDKNKLFAKQNLGIKLFSFAYPSGSIKPSAKLIISKKYDSGRVIERGLNSNPVDIAALKSVPIYEKYGIDMATEWLEMLNKKYGWLIFYTHDVAKIPSEYGCSIGLLKNIVKKCIDNNFEILTVGTTLRNFIIED